MTKLFKLLPPLLWVGAALAIFPYFAPTAYSLSLFAIRLIAALALLAVAVGSFRLRAQPHMSGSRTAVQAVAAVAVLGICLGVAMKGTDLIKPSDDHILAVIQAGLEKQGAEAASAYKDLSVTGARCDDFSVRREWKCSYKLSYTQASNDQRVTDELQDNLYLSRVTGEDITPTCGGYDFQWSGRFRASEYYSPDLEPIMWNDCDTSDDGNSFKRTLRGPGHKAAFLISRTDISAPMVPAPYSLWVATLHTEELYGKNKVRRENINCNYAPGNQLEVRCEVKGRRAVWQGTTDIFNPGGAEISANFTDTVVMVLRKGEWTAKQ